MKDVKPGIPAWGTGLTFWKHASLPLHNTLNQRRVVLLQSTNVRRFPKETTMAAKSSTAKTTSARRRKPAKRELINTGTDKRYVRRDASGRFNESDDVGRSLSQDRRKKATTASKSGQGDRGDRRR